MRLAWITVTVFFSVSLTARADSFQYSLSDNIGDAVVYLSPSLTTTTTTIPDSSLQTCSLLSYTCVSLTLLKLASSDDFQVLVNGPNGAGDVNFFFASGAFSSVGTYQTTSGDNEGTLVITSEATTAVTPEPSSLLLLSTSLLGAGLLTRKQFA